MKQFIKDGLAVTLLFGVAHAAPMFETIRMFIPAGTGGGWDTTGREIEATAKKIGVVGNFQFENVSGAGGMVGLPKFVNQRKGQGTALLVGGSVMVGAAVTNKSPVTMANVIPIAKLTEEAGVIVVPANSDIKDFGDLAKKIRSNPKAVSVAGGSAGGTDHQLLGLIVKALGKNPLDAAYVAFSGGGESKAAIMGGQVTAGISGYSEYEEQIKAGTMRALAVSAAQRIPGVNVPTLKELGVNVVATNWRGVFAAPDISDSDKEKLTDLMKKIHASQEWKDTLTKRKWSDAFATGSTFSSEIAESMRETTAVLKDLGLSE